MNGLSIFLIVVELIAIVVLSVYLGMCKHGSKENLCVCQGEGREKCIDRETRAADYRSGKFIPEFAGV
jgi:hypothetical protein